MTDEIELNELNALSFGEQLRDSLHPHAIVAYSTVGGHEDFAYFSVVLAGSGQRFRITVQTED